MGVDIIDQSMGVDITDQIYINTIQECIATGMATYTDNLHSYDKNSHQVISYMTSHIQLK